MPCTRHTQNKPQFQVAVLDNNYATLQPTKCNINLLLFPPLSLFLLSQSTIYFWLCLNYNLIELNSSIVHVHI